MLCDDNVGMVRAVGEQHPGKFNIENRPAEKHRTELDAHGIESHGVICVQGDDVLWMHADHQLSKKDLAAGLTKVLETME